MKRSFLKTAVLFLALSIIAISVYAAVPLDYPHNTTSGIQCDDCHYPGAVDFLDPAWKNDPQADIDDTPYNNFCGSCHGEGETAIYVKTHSSLTTGSRFDDWAVECRTCHWPHHIMQYTSYGSDSYVVSGESGQLDAASLTMLNAGWTDDAFAGMILIPNINSNNYNYKITGNDEDTIYVSGPIDLNEAIAGDTFAVVYNNIVQSSIDLGDIIVTPRKSGVKEVKFFNRTGPNSFADGEPMFLDGICEVCHTQTDHFRNDGTGNDPLHENMNFPAGTDCTLCHLHENGFMGMGDGAHETHVALENGPLYGPSLACDACHDMSNIPYFKSGNDDDADGLYDLSETDVCDGCHSLDAVDTAKQYWGVAGSSEDAEDSWRFVLGDESYCGSCHDSTPGDINGIPASDIAGDGMTYGFFVTGHGRTGTNYDKLSWQEDGALGNPAAGIGCADCHDLLTVHIDEENNTGRMKPGFENDEFDSNCNQCHTDDPGAFFYANSEPLFYTNYSDYETSAHTERMCSECHDPHGVSGHTAMTWSSKQDLCFQCHTDGNVQNDAISNNRPGGHVSATSIEGAFNKADIHNLGTAFNIEGKDYTLECVSCHNVHLVTGRYWDAETNKTPVTRFPADKRDPVTDELVNLQPWGDESGEKMDDFAARGSGTGGFYYNVARGFVLGDTGLPFDQPAVYQPPKAGNGYEFEFGGDILPDYTSFCLDCHTHRVSVDNPPVNWGQGIGCTDNSVDPPNQRVTCGTGHGLGAAGLPSYVSDVGTAGFWGTSGNPDILFSMNYVTRGRHNGHFMRWPYDSADRGAGINFVLSCTDCHEAHGSDRGSIIRERFNVNADGDCGAGGNDPDAESTPGEGCSDGSNWNNFCNACHYYYGGQHAGMSCGNASCHEANSIHRIIHVVDSGASTQLMLTAAGYEGDYTRPDFTPDIVSAEGHIGSNELLVTFASNVWSNVDMSLSIDPDDFWLFDVNSNETRTITNVVHNAGDDFATLILSTALTAADLDTSLIAVKKASIWNWYEGGYVNAATGTIGAQVVSAGPWPVAIIGPVPVEMSKALFAGSSIDVIFSEGVYTNISTNGQLEPSDFTIDCAGRSILSITHTPGETSALINLDTALDLSDLGVCTVTLLDNTVYDAYDNPAPTVTRTLALSDECPNGDALFSFDKVASSPTVTYVFDEQYRAVGTVGNPAVSILGNGRYTGDEDESTYIDIDNNNTCFKVSNTMTLETRIYAANIDLDYVDVNPANGLDDDWDEAVARGEGDECCSSLGDGRNSTQQRIFERKRTVQFTLFRGNWAGDGVAARAGKGRIIVKYFVDVNSRHSCPHTQWPEDTYEGADARYHQISTDLDLYPIVNNHWYRIKAVFNSDKSGIAGSNGTPVDIFMDDEGEDGNGLNENWTGYVNASRSINDSSSCKWGALPGDFIALEDQFSYIGDNVNHTDVGGATNNTLFKGQIDWLTWSPDADYTGVDDSPH